MANLYLTEQGSIVRKTGDRLIVQKNKEILLEVQCNKIDSVLIFGNVQFTTQALQELFEHGIEMALLTRAGRLIGQLTSPTTKNIELRLDQFRKYQDETFKFELSRIIVEGKIKNCLSLTASFSYNHPDIDLKEEHGGMEASIRSLGNVSSVASLRGIEGTAARIYFSCFGKMILGEFTFEGRRKHPSTDPVNALLSFGYTLVFNEILSLLDGLGFDPYLGYYHDAEYGRASLASDILEEFRALVDRFTLYLVNNRMVKPADFFKNPQDGSVYLKRETMKKYFIEYEKFLNHEFKHPETGETATLRKCFRLQAEKLAGFIRGNKTYTPFLLEI